MRATILLLAMCCALASLFACIDLDPYPVVDVEEAGADAAADGP